MPVLRPSDSGAGVGAGAGAVVGFKALVIDIDVLAGADTSVYLATKDLAYSFGNIPMSSICQFTITGSATARPVASVVTSDILAD